MSDPKDHKPLDGVRRWLALRKDAPLVSPLDAVRARLAARAERILDVAERVSSLELNILERLSPIVDNLGELVKLQLEEAREARRQRHGPPATPRDMRGSPTIIDVEVVPSDKPRGR